MYKNLNEAKESIRANFTYNIATYDAIHKYNERANLVQFLESQGSDPVSNIGNVFAVGDSRIASVILPSNFVAKANSSFDFDLVTMICFCCKGERRRRVMGGKGENEEVQVRLIFLLAKVIR